MSSVEERVVDIVAEQLGADKEKISRKTSFVNDLGADSLDQVEQLNREKVVFAPELSN